VAGAVVVVVGGNDDPTVVVVEGEADCTGALVGTVTGEEVTGTTGTAGLALSLNTWSATQGAGLVEDAWVTDDVHFVS